MHIFTTDRLLIRPLLAEDETFFCRQYTNEKVMEFNCGALSEKFAGLQFQRSLRANKRASNGGKKSVLTWAIVCKKSKSIIGTQTLSALILPYNKEILAKAKDEAIKQAELGIVLSTKVQRKGIAKEALTALINYSFSVLSLNKINAFYACNNQSSEKLFTRLGFIYDPSFQPLNTNNRYIYLEKQ